MSSCLILCLRRQAVINISTNLNDQKHDDDHNPYDPLNLSRHTISTWHELKYQFNPKCYITQNNKTFCSLSLSPVVGTNSSLEKYLDSVVGMEMRSSVCFARQWQLIWWTEQMEFECWIVNEWQGAFDINIGLMSPLMPGGPNMRGGGAGWGDTRRC